MDTKANKMLIDATHPEETRVVVLRNGRVEEFDFESAARAQLRGNIYLAKVTRVEPSLQAAFVEYGGNRHGFLAFNEIHPDYYQIPMADKQALLEEEARAEAEADAEADARAERRAGRQRHTEEAQDHDGDNGDFEGDGADEPVSADGAASLNGDGGTSFDEEARSAALEVRNDDPVLIELPPPAAVEKAAADPIAEAQDGTPSLGGGLDDQAADDDQPSGDHIEEVSDVGEAPEVIGAGAVEDTEDDVVEEVQERPRRPRRRSYKIQEVIKRRQVILVQVVKEERGNKGAALTTYLSLAGRYTVLMPNTGRGGGISRKITNAVDRKRLKSIAQELDVPEGMGLIIRTAGAARTNQEIKRDYEYLLRLWESVRELTLNSTAPSLVYEEGNLIKRSIRDLYSKEIDEIVVAGDHAYSEAVDFMRMLMPSHAKNVIRHAAPEALFARYQIERQLNAFFSPQVTLRSGGYIVINQTEALVAIDVNSGKSTREYSIEETALNTNLEAADEIARQLKLRDLAGLIVVDFIDMEEKRNNRAVERRLKDALRFDRARIQVGRISHFGLLEMSRQRMRTGMLEGSTSQCPHCQGTGMIRSTESVALAVLRGLEDHLNKDPRSSVTVLTTAAVALYILNNKRQFIAEIEDRFGVAVAVQASERMHGANYAVERSSAPPPVRRAPVRPAVNMDWGFDDEDNEPPSETASNVDFVETNDDYEDRRPAERRSEDGDREEGRDGGRRRRRRRRRGRDRDRDDRPREASGADYRGGESGDDVDDLQASGDDDADETVDRNEGGARGVRERQTDDDHGDDVETDRDDMHGASEDGERSGEQGDGRKRRRRRRGRRGGRRGREGDVVADAGTGDQPDADEDATFATSADNDDGVAGDDDGSARAEAPVVADAPRQRRDEDNRPAPVAVEQPVAEPTQARAAAPEATPPPVAPPPPVAAPTPTPVAVEPPKPKLAVSELPAEPDEPNRPARRGWWQRRILGE